MTLRTPAGIPASSDRAHAYKADNGVCSAIKVKYVQVGDDKLVNKKHSIIIYSKKKKSSM